jgi:hypothetical protein
MLTHATLVWWKWTHLTTVKKTVWSYPGMGTFCYFQDSNGRFPSFTGSFCYLSRYLIGNIHLGTHDYLSWSMASFRWLKIKYWWLLVGFFRRNLISRHLSLLERSPLTPFWLDPTSVWGNFEFERVYWLFLVLRPAESSNVWGSVWRMTSKTDSIHQFTVFGSEDDDILVKSDIFLQLPYEIWKLQEQIEWGQTSISFNIVGLNQIFKDPNYMIFVSTTRNRPTLVIT